MRLASRAPFRLAFFALVAAALVWPILPDAARLNEFRDVHHLFFYERSAIDTIKRFGELPLWNPFYCGGFDAVGAPQTRFMSPTLLLGLLFGAERAEILTVFFFAILGMEGMYRWLKLRVTTPLAAMLVAPVFALSGQFTVAYYRGWIQFFGFQLVPWILLGITLAVRRRPIGMLIASIAFAWLLGFAGFFAAPMLAVAGMLEATRALLEEPRGMRVRSLGMLAATGSFMATVAFVRLWPVAETLLSAPRIMAGTPSFLPRALLSALVGVLAVKDGNTDLQGSFYVGAAFLGVVALGAHNWKSARTLIVVVLFVWLAAGYARQPSLFGLFRTLPVFSSLRYPERFLWFAILFACEPAANALSRVPLLGEGRRWRVGTWLLLTGALAWTVFGQLAAFERVAKARTLGVVSDTESKAEFHQSRGNRWLTVHLQSMNIGSLSCYETHRLAQSPLLRGDLPAEEYLAPSSRDAGTVKRTSWSPNRIGMHADITRPSRVLVNQNWAPGWNASVGTVVSNDGLLAVDLPAGSSDVVLSFRPWSTMGGAAVTAAALLALGFLLWRARRRGDLFSTRQRTTTAFVILLPWAVAAIARASSPDAKWPPPPMRNPNGSEAVIEVERERQIPAPPIGAELELPLRVEAGRVLGPDERNNITVEVYFRRTASLSRSTTMFVHVERRKEGQSPAPKGRDEFFNADHQVVGGSFYLSDTPQGRLVRDATGVHLDKAASGVWDVWVSFGHVSGHLGRSKVLSPGAATVDADRVRIGTFAVP